MKTQIQFGNQEIRKGFPELLNSKYSILLSLCLLTACASTGWQTTTGKVLATTVQTVDACMKGWAQYVKATNLPADKQASVRAAYTRYQLAESVAQSAWAGAVAAKDQSVFTSAEAALLNSKDNLLLLIQSFEPSIVNTNTP